ncbi:MAG: hypothetical protein GX860_10410 [Alcaligenaceae bacterium]|jgi:hypothetical protein|nr:hypothetical protein [Alcaligenaceae bacterium]
MTDKINLTPWGDNIRAWYKDDNIMGWAEFDKQGNFVTCCKDQPFCHWPSEYNNEISNTIKSLTLPPFTCDVYLRFNDIPKNGISKNWATGINEKGLSVYQLKYDLINGCYKITGKALQGALITYILKQSPIYFVTGEQIATGSDNEPLLSNVKILSKAKYSPEKEGYIIKA